MEKEVRSARARYVGPTCFGFEEVQPAKLSLRDVESSSFFSLFYYLPLSFPLFFHRSLLYFYLSADFTRFSSLFVTALPPLIHRYLGRSGGTLFMEVYASTPVLS